MKTKTKKTKTKKVAPGRKVRAREFEAHYLALVLIVFLLLEGFTITSTTALDWQEGMQVLDVSSGFAKTVTDMNQVFQPITNTISDVSTFYQLAATEATPLFDLSSADIVGEINLVTTGVAEFYESASVELTHLFDFSETTSWPQAVAGVSVTAY